MSGRAAECGQSEHVSLHAVRSLPPGEARAVERHLATCAECWGRMEELAPVVASFVAWPTDVLRPPEALWDRLAERLALDPTSALPAAGAPAWVEPDWEDVAPGIAVKLLASDAERDRVSMLVRLDPGTDYPPHRHAGVEELHLLHGELRIDAKTLHPGDAIRSEPGSIDHRVWSETGCTCVLITSPSDVLR